MMKPAAAKPKRTPKSHGPGTPTPLGTPTSSSASRAGGDAGAPSETRPRLRFPEFRDAPGWACKPMGEVYSFKGNNSFSRDQLNYERGSVKNIHYGDIHTKFSTLFDVTKETVPFINPSESLDGFRSENDCVEGDMILADVSEDLEDVGKSIEVVRLHGERVVAGQHTILARPNDDNLVVGFGAYLFKSRRVRTQIQKEAQGAKVLGISATRLTKIELPIPSTKAEQHKIASCLSSLDDLIGAESQKLAALKAHKQGLMQQLFPLEGETVPRLRFPEFQNAPEWSVKKLNELLFETKHRNRSLELGPNDVLSVSGEFGCVNQIEFMGRSYAGVTVKDYHVVELGDIVYTKSPLKKNPYGIIKENKWKRGIVSTLYAVYRPFSGCSATYLDHFFSVDYNLNAYLQPIVRKGAKNDMKVNNADVLKGDICVPEIQEQQKIATYLSSLDTMIAAQGDKVEALKSHKKGLMQQLFPSPAEAEA
ncbi:MAG: restriction endonuclease subunit S [Lentisphaeria bacterium]